MSYGDTVVSSRGMGGVVPRQSIYEESTTQNHALGDMLILTDGRKFRYCANSTAALTAHYMTSGPTVVANHTNMATALAAIGAKALVVTVGATAVTANQYANGYAWFNAGTGIGDIYKVKSHLANAGSLAMTVNLYDPLVLATAAADTKTSLCKNPFKDVVVFPATTATNRPTGVPLIGITASTAALTYYFWAQTAGLCTVYCGATYTVGGAISVDDTAGFGLTIAGYPAFQWGVIVEIAAAAEKPNVVHLNID